MMFDNLTDPMYELKDYKRLLNEFQSRQCFTYYFELLLWTFLQLWTVAGNIITLKILLSKSSQRTSSNYLVASLTASDLCLSILSNPLSHGALFYSYWPYSDTVCQYQGVISIGLVCVSVDHLVLMALNRYFCVVRRSKYNTYFSTRRTLLYIFFAWTSAFVVPGLYIITGRKYVFNPGKIFCFLKVEEVFFYISIFMCYILTSNVVFDVCYYKIHQVIKEHKKNLQKWGHSSDSLSIQEINATRILFITVIIYYICSSPILLIDLIDLIHQRWWLPREAYFTYTICATLIGFVNPIIYGIMNPVFRAEYKKLLFTKRRLRLRNCKVFPRRIRETAEIHTLRTMETKT